MIPRPPDRPVAGMQRPAAISGIIASPRRSAAVTPGPCRAGVDDEFEAMMDERDGRSPSILERVFCLLVLAALVANLRSGHRAPDVHLDAPPPSAGSRISAHHPAH